MEIDYNNEAFRGRFDALRDRFTRHYPQLGYYNNFPATYHLNERDVIEVLAYWRHWIEDLMEGELALNEEVNGLIDQYNAFIKDLPYYVGDAIDELMASGFFNLANVVSLNSQENRFVDGNEVSAINSLLNFATVDPSTRMSAIVYHDIDDPNENKWTIRDKKDEYTPWKQASFTTPRDVTRIWADPVSNTIVYISGAEGDRVVYEATYTANDESIIIGTFNAVSLGHVANWVLNYSNTYEHNFNSPRNIEPIYQDIHPRIMYMTNDYKVFQYDTVTHTETLLFTLPDAVQAELDPVASLVSDYRTLVVDNGGDTYSGWVIRGVHAYTQNLDSDHNNVYSNWQPVTFKLPISSHITPYNSYSQNGRVYVDYGGYLYTKINKEITDAGAFSSNLEIYEAKNAFAPAINDSEAYQTHKLTESNGRAISLIETTTTLEKLVRTGWYWFDKNNADFATMPLPVQALVKSDNLGQLIVMNEPTIKATVEQTVSAYGKTTGVIRLARTITRELSGDTHVYTFTKWQYRGGDGFKTFPSGMTGGDISLLNFTVPDMAITMNKQALNAILDSPMKTTKPTLNPNNHILTDGDAVIRLLDLANTDNGYFEQEITCLHNDGIFVVSRQVGANPNDVYGGEKPLVASGNWVIKLAVTTADANDSDKMFTVDPHLNPNPQYYLPTLWQDHDWITSKGEPVWEWWNNGGKHLKYTGTGDVTLNGGSSVDGQFKGSVDGTFKGGVDGTIDVDGGGTSKLPAGTIPPSITHLPSNTDFADWLAKITALWNWYNHFSGGTVNVSTPLWSGSQDDGAPGNYVTLAHPIDDYDYLEIDIKGYKQSAYGTVTFKVHGSSAPAIDASTQADPLALVIDNVSDSNPNATINQSMFYKYSASTLRVKSGTGKGISMHGDAQTLANAIQEVDYPDAGGTSIIAVRGIKQISIG